MKPSDPPAIEKVRQRLAEVAEPLLTAHFEEQDRGYFAANLKQYPGYVAKRRADDLRNRMLWIFSRLVLTEAEAAALLSAGPDNAANRQSIRDTLRLAEALAPIPLLIQYFAAASEAKDADPWVIEFTKHLATIQLETRRSKQK